MTEWLNDWLDDWMTDWMTGWTTEPLNEWAKEWMMPMRIMTMVILNLGRIYDPQHGIDLARNHPQHFVAHQAFWLHFNFTTNNMTTIYRDCLPSKVQQAKQKAYFYAQRPSTRPRFREAVWAEDRSLLWGLRFFWNSDPQGSVVLGSFFRRISPKSGLKARRLRL